MKLISELHENNKTLGGIIMATYKFNIRRITGTAVLEDVGAVYSTYTRFAEEAGFPEAVVNPYIEGNKLSQIERSAGNEVRLLARGFHEDFGNIIFVAETSRGEKFLIARRGLMHIDYEEVPEESFGIKRIVGSGLFINEGGIYPNYKAFANAAGYPDAIGLTDGLEGIEVSLKAVGEHSGNGDTVFVAETPSGRRFMASAEAFENYEYKYDDEEGNELQVKVERYEEALRELLEVGKTSGIGPRSVVRIMRLLAKEALEGEESE